MTTIQDIINELNALFENREFISDLKITDPSDHLNKKIAEIDDEIQFLLARLNLLQNKERDVAEQYKILFLKYVSVFCDKHEAHFEFYNNQEGIFIADTYISYSDIRDDVDNDVPKDWIWEYTDECLEGELSNNHIKYSYEQWLLKEKNFKFKTKEQSLLFYNDRLIRNRAK